MKSFKMNEHHNVVEYIYNIKSNAFDLSMYSVIIVGYDPISNVVVVSCAYFSQYTDAEQFFNQKVKEELPSSIYQIYSDDTFVHSDRDFPWEE